jgi:hypothetical protein
MFAKKKKVHLLFGFRVAYLFNLAMQNTWKFQRATPIIRLECGFLNPDHVH